MLKSSDVKVVRVRLRPLKERPNLLAFVDLTAGDFKILGISLVQHSGSSRVTLEFPELPITRKCRECFHRGLLQNRYCGHCGIRLPKVEPFRKENGFLKLAYATVHPRDIPSRRVIESVVFGAYVAALLGPMTPIVEAEPGPERLMLEARQPHRLFRPLAEDQFEEFEEVEVWGAGA